MNCENPRIVQGDMTLLVEVHSPLYEDVRDKLACFADLSNNRDLFEVLEDDFLIPEKVIHNAEGTTFHKIRCAHKASKPSEPVAKKIQLKESVFIALQTENAAFLKALIISLKELGIEPLFPAEAKTTCLVPSEARTKLQQALKKLSKEFLVEIS